MITTETTRISCKLSATDDMNRLGFVCRAASSRPEYRFMHGVLFLTALDDADTVTAYACDGRRAHWAVLDADWVVSLGVDVCDQADSSGWYAMRFLRRTKTVWTFGEQFDIRYPNVTRVIPVKDRLPHSVAFDATKTAFDGHAIVASYYQHVDCANWGFLPVLPTDSLIDLAVPGLSARLTAHAESTTRPVRFDSEDGRHGAVIMPVAPIA